MRNLIISIGDTVSIVGTGLCGTVTAILHEPGNISYRIRLWDEHKQEQHWLFDFEIKKVLNEK